MSARRNERGQALIWVAIVFVLLLATLALAVDFGNIWSQRRHMQNAADAAALEAARARCFANASPPAAAASGAAYAKPPHNLASSAQVTPSEDGWTFSAKVATEAPTYFAGAFGVSSVHVEAGARATCGASNGACNPFPTAFSEEIWNFQLAGRCGRSFYVWSSDADSGTGRHLNCDVLDCDVNGDGLEEVFSDEGRTWVDFSGATSPGYPPGCSSNNGQGASELKCWVSGSGYQAAVPLPNWVCKDNGVKWGVKNEVFERISLPYPLSIVHIPLIADPPDGSQPPARSCSGEDLIYLSSYGCAQVVGAQKDLNLCEKDNPKKCYHFKVIQMAVSCDKACNSGCGTSAGGEGSVRGVGLLP